MMPSDEQSKFIWKGKNIASADCFKRDTRIREHGATLRAGRSVNHAQKYETPPAWGRQAGSKILNLLL
jgi:hypothetical protein